MNKSAMALANMANDVADAKTVKEFSSDRLKRAFSVTVAEFLKAGDGVGASEHKARASEAYGAQIHDLSEQFKTALRVIETAEGMRVRYESARSILAVERQKLGL